MIKSLTLAVAVLSLSVGAARAGEGNGDPFPFASTSPLVADVPTAVIQMTGPTPLMTKMPPNSIPSGNRLMASTMRQYGQVTITSGDTLPATASQTPVQTVNSLPADFEDGTVPYEQAEAMGNYLAQHGPDQATRAYTQAAQRSPEG